MSKTIGALQSANTKARAYALVTTNLRHAEVMLRIANQYKDEPAYIKSLEAHLERLRGE